MIIELNSKLLKVLDTDRDYLYGIMVDPDTKSISRNGYITRSSKYRESDIVELNNSIREIFKDFMHGVTTYIDDRFDASIKHRNWKYHKSRINQKSWLIEGEDIVYIVDAKLPCWRGVDERIYTKINDSNLNKIIYEKFR